MMQLINDPYGPQPYGSDPYGTVGKLGRLHDLQERVRPIAVPVRSRPLRIWYDCEFVEDGRTIDLLSIGMVAEDGRELYRVNGDYEIMDRAVRHDWLRENVAGYLPVHLYQEPGYWVWEPNHPDFEAVRDRDRIRDDVEQFIRDSLAISGYDDVRLWAWYGAYDHVAYAQLFGKMIDLPEGFPMWTNDLKQEVDRIGNPKLPDLPGKQEHHALADALELRHRHLWLDGRMV